MRRLVRSLWLVTRDSAASNDRRCVNYHRACERLADRHSGLRRLARICVCGSVRFRPEQICAVTDSVSEQQRSVHSISNWVRNSLTNDLWWKCPVEAINNDNCHHAMCYTMISYDYQVKVLFNVVQWMDITSLKKHALQVDDDNCSQHTLRTDPK